MGRLVGRGAQLLLAACLLVWTGAAVHFQLDGGDRHAALAGLAAVAVVFLLLAVTSRWGRLWAGTAGLLAVAGVWWTTLEPRQNRDWRPEVARGVAAEFNPDGTVTVHNIRDFRWSSPTVAKEAWDTRSYDPEQIASVDMILSIWGSPLIAHSLVSFGFEDGRHLVFSGEIRKERDEEYSTLGGFFRKFELVLIAADERDIVHLRTDARGEAVSLYPVEMAPELREDFFLSLLRLGNDLAERPRWYNTALMNCTTLPFRLLRRLSGTAVPLDPAVLFSGWLPEYTYRLGVLPDGLTLEEIRDRARLDPMGSPEEDGVAFSRRLRESWTD